MPKAPRAENSFRPRVPFTKVAPPSLASIPELSSTLGPEPPASAFVAETAPPHAGTQSSHEAR
jgi:hypothetical protein